jgi:DNA-binding NarL/FixJ family response regulator
MENGQVGVVIVEDHPLYRFALEHALRRDRRLRLVASFSDGAEAAEAIPDLDADVVLLDLGLPGMDGQSLLAQLTAAGVGAPMVVLSADTRGESVHRALLGGACGYLSKDLDAKGICAATVAASRGESVVSRHLQAAVVDEIRAQASNPATVLTAREREVIALVAQGESTCEIGRRLFISESTVKTHLSAVYGKLGVRDRGAAIVQVVKRGLVSID